MVNGQVSYLLINSFNMYGLSSFVVDMYTLSLDLKINNTKAHTCKLYHISMILEK